jgi:hypothetical protein
MPSIRTKTLPRHFRRRRLETLKRWQSGQAVPVEVITIDPAERYQPGDLERIANESTLTDQSDYRGRYALAQAQQDREFAGYLLLCNDEFRRLTQNEIWGLKDYGWRAMWDAGETPREAARAVFRAVFGDPL